MLATHYTGSKGPVPIATMPYPHLANAHAKLVREGDPARAAEIEAMRARIAELDAEHAKLEEERGEGPAAEAAEAAALAQDENPRIHLGANNPPEAMPFEAIKVHIEDLLLEAHNWADGTTVESDAQAQEAGRLISDLEDAAKAAEAERVKEKAPLDKQIADIQARYNVYIADRKNKTPGRVWKAVDALKATVKPYLDRKEQERRAEAQRVQEEALKAAKEAAAAAQAARASDLGAQEDTEDKIAKAQQLLAAAKGIENTRVQLDGGARAKGLRKTYTPVLTDAKAAMLHYMVQDRQEFLDLIGRLAARDVREGKRTIPGFDVVEGTAL